METQTVPSKVDWIDQVEIRPLRQSDLPALEWDGEYAHFRRVYQNNFERIAMGEALAWVADLPGAGVIGQVFIQLNCARPELANGCTRAYFFSFRIRPDYRDRGLGSRMMHVFEDDLRQRGFKLLTLNVAKDNPRAIKLYQCNGYRITAHEPGKWSYPDDRGDWHQMVEPAWRMEKNLV
ncbi:MAG TPA: N-acetyltransferase [Longilinea sp.]|nr:N-acetyltransferase [Longilinea sp.]